MHICLTDDKTSLLVSVEASTVLMTRRDPQNKLITHVITGIMGPNGLQALAVREGPMEVARRVNAALRAQHSDFKLDAPEAVLGFENN